VRILRPAELVRAAAIARRYYLDGKSKVEIAREFGLSRFKVARVLDEARATGLVRIDITVPAEIDAELSDALRTAFGLREAIAVATGADSDEGIRGQLGQIAADYLTEVVTEDDVLGLACSRTLNAMSLALAELPRVPVVQLTGVHPGPLEETSVELVRRVAGVARGPAYPIYAPLVVSDAATTRGLRRQPQVLDAMRRYRQVTKAVVAVGALEPSDSFVADLVSAADRETLHGRGIHTEVCARLLDDDGEEVPELADRVIAITIDQLRQIPEVIAVAGGARKIEAIRAALKGGFVTSLITDTDVAGALLARPPGPMRAV
jgi:DNA-binding transcriptional regulator LsrR (DeoR family)